MDDHFSKIAEQYARGRFGYPNELYEFLASLCGKHELAWDCACGTGQAAADLARFFDQVIATDISPELLALAPADSRISCRRTAAEKSGLEENSVDLLVVAQAIHWFDLPPFWMEVSRVLKSGGVLAFWGYNWPGVTPAVDQVLESLKQEIASDWPERSAILHNGYRVIEPPFRQIDASRFEMSASWTLADYLAHLRSWSGTRYFNERVGGDVVEEYKSAFDEAWRSEELRVTWPLILKVYRKD